MTSKHTITDKSYEKSAHTEHDMRVLQLTTFNEIGKALTSSLDIKEVLNVVMEKISEILQPKNWSLLMVDDEREELYFEIIVGEHVESFKDIRLKIGEGIAGWVAKEGKPLLVSDVNKDPRFSDKAAVQPSFHTKSIACVPMQSRGKCLGVIELINKDEEKNFGEEDLLLLTTLADYTAIAIENANYFQKVQQLTITDDLTKLFNSRYLYHFLDYEVERARRYNTSLSMIFLDLDQFKEVNDQFGHIIGSKILAEVASVLRSGMRKVDIACRYGGDEFVIVMPQTPKANAHIAATKMRILINNHVFLKDEGINYHITASFGVAAYPKDAKDKQQLLHLADTAMYTIKNNAKDGIAMA